MTRPTSRSGDLRRCVFGAAAMALALSIAAPSTVHAERGAPREADALFEQGKSALKRGDWTKACDYFRRSLAIDPSPSTHVKLARCHERDGEFKAASDNYTRALELLGNRSKGDAHARELESLIRSAKESVDARLGSFELVLVPRPPKFVVVIDGKRLDGEPGSGRLVVDPGSHDVGVEAEGYGAESARVDLPAGAPQIVTLRLTPMQQTAPKSPVLPRPASAAMATPAQVGSPQLHEQRRAMLAPTTGGAANSRSVLAARPAPSPAAHASVAVSGSRPRDPAAAPLREGTSQRVVAALTGGAGIIGFGVATGLLWKARSLVDEARVGEHCDASVVCNQEGKALMDKAERRQTYALVVAAGSTVLVGTGLALWLTAPAARKQTDHASLRLTLGLAPTAAYLRGQW